MAKALDANEKSILEWEHRGVPASSFRAMSRLDQLAEKWKFDSGMVMEDRDWNAETLKVVYDEVKNRGISKTRFAIIVGTAATVIATTIGGRKKIGRSLAWRLTRASASLQLPLPPVIDSSRWAPRTSQNGES